MQRNRRKFFERLLLALAIGFLIAVAPMPVWTPAWFLHWQVPAMTALLVCYVGKLLIDTLFCPRH
jgi:hypothetical protein